MKIILVLISGALVVSCLEGSGKKNTQTELFPLTGKEPLRAEAIPIDSLIKYFPWSQWDIEYFRPEKAFKAFYFNTMSDSIELLMCLFPVDYLAFGLFSKYRERFSREKSYYYMGNFAVFYQKKAVATLSLPKNQYWTDLKISDFKALFEADYLVPKIFKSFPVKYRIPNSESVIPHHFLGTDYLGEVVSVQYLCSFDTARIFRSFFNPEQRVFYSLVNKYSGRIDTVNTKILKFWGTNDFNFPVLVYGYSHGIIGTEGCKDREIAEELAQKTLKLNILLP
jgi:hypothetical protein